MIVFVPVTALTDKGSEFETTINLGLVRSISPKKTGCQITYSDGSHLNLKTTREEIFHRADDRVKGTFERV